MGARQSKRSVDITTTPKKGGEDALGAAGEGKLEPIPDLDQKITTNGVAPHSDIEFADKEEANDAVEEPLAAKDEQPIVECSIAAKPEPEIKENGVSENGSEEQTPQLDEKTTESNETAGGDQTAAVESSVEKTEEQQEVKKKDKSKKKKWSFRSISFSKKDKSKPQKADEKSAEVKEVAEENAEEVVSPAVEETPKLEADVVVPEKPIEIENGEATNEELTKIEEAPVVVKEPVVVAVVDEEKPAVEVVEAPKAPEEPKPTTITIKEEVSVPEAKVEAPVVVPQADVVSVVAEKEEEEEELEVPQVKEIEVRKLEDMPPPLPASNPPSPVTVFAESTKDEPLVSESPKPEEPIASPLVVVVEPVTPSETSVVVDDLNDKAKEATDLVNETIVVADKPEEVPDVAQIVESPPSSPVVVVAAVDDADQVDEQQQQQAEVVVDDAIVVESSTPPPSLAVDSISEPICNNADSLPDISTESLPSLPEPISESLPEPMSLPPVEFVPEPIAAIDPPMPPPQELDVAKEPLLNGSAAKTNGFHSPLVEDLLSKSDLPDLDGTTVDASESNITTKEGLKQVQNVGDVEVRPENAEKIVEQVAESTTPATTTVEE